MTKDEGKETLLTCDNHSCYPCLCHLLPVNMHGTLETSWTKLFISRSFSQKDFICEKFLRKIKSQQNNESQKLEVVQIRDKISMLKNFTNTFQGLPK